ncbi:hypothetical protein C1N70_20020 [Cytobacillus firmus]
MVNVNFYRSLTGSKTPASRLSVIKGRISGGQTARKGPIGSTNNQLVKNPPLIEVSLYLLKEKRLYGNAMARGADIYPSA